jgi:SepF-like predicted cell division protein (DUF552 family)
MGKGLLHKLKEEQQPQHSEQYIDLGALEMSGDLKEGGATGPELRVAEIHKYEDLQALVTMVYNGDVILIDYSPIASDELLLRRITNELKYVITDTNGDVAALKKNLLVVTPTGMKISRKILRGSE